MLLVLGLAVQLRGDLPQIPELHSHHGDAGELTGTSSFSTVEVAKERKGYERLLKMPPSTDIIILFKSALHYSLIINY